MNRSRSRAVAVADRRPALDPAVAWALAVMLGLLAVAFR